MDFIRIDHACFSFSITCVSCYINPVDGSINIYFLPIQNCCQYFEFALSSSVMPLWIPTPRKTKVKLLARKRIG